MTAAELRALLLIRAAHLRTVAARATQQAATLDAALAQLAAGAAPEAVRAWCAARYLRVPARAGEIVRAR